MAKLIVNPTSSSKREIGLPKSMLYIGRDPSNDLVLPDAMVSRRHAVVEYRGNQYYIRDCNSSNGSLVNGDKVSERNLRDGDLVAIGTARLLFREDLEVEGGGSKVVRHPSSPRLSCPSCQAECKQGDVFCRKCGARVVDRIQPKVVCTSCGTVVSLPAEFCNACGATVSRGDDALEITKPRPVADEEVAPPREPFRDTSSGAGSPSEDDRRDERDAPEDTPTGLAPKLEEVKRLPPPPPRQPQPPPPRSLSSPPARAAQRVAAPARARPQAGQGSEPAGLDRRLVAGLLDAGIVFLLQASLLAPVFLYWWTRVLPRELAEVFPSILLSLGLLFLSALLGAVYYVYFWGVSGATPGKRLLGLAVEGTDGSFPIGISQAAVRFLGYLLSAAVLGVGFVVILFGITSLHDRIAATRVVQRERA